MLRNRVFILKTYIFPEPILMIFMLLHAREEAEKLLLRVLMNVPKDIRMQRVKNRSFQKFGRRMLPGEDSYKLKEAFFEFVATKAENAVEEWGRPFHCPVTRTDGAKPIEASLDFIIGKI